MQLKVWHASHGGIESYDGTEQGNCRVEETKLYVFRTNSSVEFFKSWLIFASGYRALPSTSSIRVLVVDDHDSWRRFFSTTLQKEPGLEEIGQASDGLQAVELAERRKPDLILLDIGLPILNGIEAARRIRELCPASRILFVSQNRSPDVIKAALNAGACGYVIKSDAARELLPALQAVLRGDRFISTLAMCESLSDLPKIVPALPEERFAAKGCHECEFYRDDSSLVEGFTEYIKRALQAGAAVTFVATESHRASVFQRLEPHLLKQGMYTSVDVTEALSTLIREDGRLDVVQCTKVLGELIPGASHSATSEHDRVAACGELAPVLLKEGKIEAAIEMEHLTTEFARKHNIDIFCGYSNSAMPPDESSTALRRIRLEHSLCRGTIPD